MKKRITKRDVACFVIGMFTFLLIDAIWNWDESVKGFKDGWNDGARNMKIESGK
ncbi:MAG: hypothetical protein WC384_17815 [Prolixibacteraceae bacterium]